ncbi:hypothetical protein PoB_006444900 [Plakobranchus ocellatus]|uniref:Uncharacterized protein n=1 Tax=Plakobranchus ocellatus TaxID=259542 RepID=A0AAV4D168_9GAST|nr:hypothetical protein PoB_006444900 [Plakobranchus ocellatus]
MAYCSDCIDSSLPAKKAGVGGKKQRREKAQQVSAASAGPALEVTDNVLSEAIDGTLRSASGKAQLIVMNCVALGDPKRTRDHGLLILIAGKSDRQVDVTKDNGCDNVMRKRKLSIRLLLHSCVCYLFMTILSTTSTPSLKKKKKYEIKSKGKKQKKKKRIQRAHYMKHILTRKKNKHAKVDRNITKSQLQNHNNKNILLRLRRQNLFTSFTYLMKAD